MKQPLVLSKKEPLLAEARYLTEEAFLVVVGASRWTFRVCAMLMLGLCGAVSGDHSPCFDVRRIFQGHMVFREN